jgi:hypothetical protein
MHGDKLNGYILSIGRDPFHVIFFSQQQLQTYIESCKKDGGCTTHMDATGSVMRDLPGQKRPLYYCLLLSNNSLPVCNILTTRHTSESIQARLLTFNHFVRVVNANKFVQLKYIVVDFSYALINACVRSFNEESLSRYLRRCHQWRGHVEFEGLNPHLPPRQLIGFAQNRRQIFWEGVGVPQYLASAYLKL